MKKILLILGIILVLAGCSHPVVFSIPFNAEDVMYVSYTRTTEAGISTEETTDPDIINDIYLRLSGVEIVSASDEGVDDNGLEIEFTTEEDIYNYTFEGDVFASENYYQVSGVDPLRDYIDGLLSDAPVASNDYDILEGLAMESDGDTRYMHCNGFVLSMPDNDDWGYKQLSSTSFALYYLPALDSGGHLATITAYDDTSYEELPSYSIAAEINEKTIIAEYPTDVQYDSNSEKEYKKLYDHLRKIGSRKSPLRAE